MPHDLIQAMLKLDTPKIRDFIRQTWDKGGAERKKLLEKMQSHYWNHSHLDWLVPKIEQLTDKDERNIGIGFLPRIGTDNAKAMLEKWAKDPDKKIAKTAQWHLKKIAKTAQWHLNKFEQKRKEDRDKQISQESIDQLLSGRIKPDDLLHPAQVYVWNGEKYVSEKQ
jgi:hypothetical protein